MYKTQKPFDTLPNSIKKKLIKNNETNRILNWQISSRDYRRTIYQKRKKEVIRIKQDFRFCPLFKFNNKKRINARVLPILSR